MLTTDANATVRPLHDRMPVILTDEHQAAWIDPGVTDAAKLEPLPDSELGAHPVTPKMNNWRFDGAECVEPIGLS